MATVRSFCEVMRHNGSIKPRSRVASWSTVSVLALCNALTACQATLPVSGETLPAATVPIAAAGWQQQCEALAGTRLDLATIDEARPVRRGEQVIGFVKRVVLRLLMSDALPDLAAPSDFCLVTAKLRPESASEITAEVWLPHQWNGKLVGIGGGGFNGGLSAAAFILGTPVGKGYAGVITDAGHPLTGSAKFVHDSPEQYVDYAYRANHVAAGFAKTLVAVYYGVAAKRAYFHGCSNGGRDALMLARRYPEDYDGIIAGAPAAGWSKFTLASLWNYQAIQSAPNLRDKLELVQRAVMDKCDALDGVKDQLLENPSSCSFDPAELQCTSGDGDDCLNADEVTALRKIYGGPRLRDGTQIYAGMPVGGEALPDNWEGSIVAGKDGGGQAGTARESMRWMVYGDAEWDLDRFDLDRDYLLVKERIAPMMDSDDPDLSAYTGRGGKLLLYHGWNDAVIPAGATVAYYAELRQALGSSADRQIRLFMVPGVAHCGGGVGPNIYDLYTEIDRWVESDAAPERITATEYNPPAVFGPAAGAKVVRTRPLCSWPKVARYNGSGSTDDQASFSCR
jgi:pimeloyl-ACP methyl ester carboxylesterase